MNPIDDIAAALPHAGIGPEVEAGMGMWRGWDYWAREEPATDGRGVARAPHRFGEADDGRLPAGAARILAPTMTSVELAGGIWRQCLIRPGDDAAPDGPDRFAISDIDAPCLSSAHLVALLGHQPRDIALYLTHQRQYDPAMFDLVLAKRFKAAIARDPAIVSRPWPDAVRRRWRGTEGDYLPPFLATVLYAELARSAQSQAGLLALAFDGGVELTTKGFLERVAVSGGAGSAAAVDSAISYAPFQTVALTPPDLMLNNKDRAGITIWGETAAASLALAAGRRGDLTILPGNADAAARLRAGYEAHPQFALEARKNKGHSRQPHRAATFWGLNWRRNAAVRLLELALTARDWNRVHRPGGPRLPDASAGQRASIVARAIAAISFRWVAEHSTAAGLTVLSSVITKADKIEQDFKHWTPADITPLTIDDHLGERSSVTLLDDAWEHYRRLSAPGAFGYTARSQAHLWIDDEGDDIGHYLAFQQQALHRHEEAAKGMLPPELQDTTRVPAEVVALLGRQHGIKRRRPRAGNNQPSLGMTADPAAARGAQQQGLMISALSTDPMLARLLR